MLRQRLMRLELGARATRGFGQHLVQRRIVGLSPYRRFQELHGHARPPAREQGPGVTACKRQIRRLLFVGRRVDGKRLLVSSRAHLDLRLRDAIGRLLRVASDQFLYFFPRLLELLVALQRQGVAVAFGVGVAISPLGQVRLEATDDLRRFALRLRADLGARVVELGTVRARAARILFGAVARVGDA